MTLARKAELFERRLRQRHVREGLVASSALAGPGDVTSSRTCTNDNDGLWKTTTFYIYDAGFDNSQKGNMDFRLYNGGTHDLTVGFVRVIKTNSI